MAKKTKTANEERRYRLLVGLHKDKDGLHNAKDPKTRIIKSKVDLVKRFGPEKFARVSEDDDNLESPPSSGADGTSFDNMSDAQLAQYAEDNDIDLSPARNREEAIEILKHSVESEDDGE